MLQHPDALTVLLSCTRKHQMKVLTGVRGSGKTSILQQFRLHLINNGVSQSHIIFFHLETAPLDTMADFQQLYLHIKAQLPHTGKYYIVLEEVQHVSHWEKVVLALHSDPNADLTIASSISILQLSGIPLAVQKQFVEIKLLPLSFRAFVQNGHLPCTNSPKEQLQNYLQFGGLPITTKLPQDPSIIREMLRGNYYAILIRDIAERNAVRDSELLRQIVRYLIADPDNTIHQKRLLSEIPSAKQTADSRGDTIGSYLKLLEQIFLFYRVPRFDLKNNRLLKTRPKYYMVDSGMWTTLLGRKTIDKCSLLRSVVYFELIRRGYQVVAGKWYTYTIDFLATRATEQICFQVMLHLKDEERCHNALAAFRPLPPQCGRVILSMHRENKTDLNGVRYQNLIDFLLEPIEAEGQPYTRSERRIP